MTDEREAVVDLSILIVSWNVRDHVLACLASIEADPDRPAIEVVLVDNASTDDTVAAVRRAYPWVRVIENADNVGFPRANNQALRSATGRHVLYLNPDTEVRPGTLRACITELDATPDAGAVGCRIDYPDGRIQYECARSRYRFRHLVYEVLYLHMLFPRSRVFGEHRLGWWDHRGSRDVEALSGAFMMVPRQLAARLGGLPEDVFMYHEDLSFCMRIARAGHRLRYRGDVSIVHHSGQSARRSDARLGMFEAEATQRLIRESDGRFAGALSRAVIALRSVVRLTVCAGGVVLPPRLRRSWPRVFDWRRHSVQLAWALSPALTHHVMRERAPTPVTAGLREAES